MKVTYVSQRTRPEKLTGSEIYLHALAQAAASRYDVEVLATYRKPKEVEGPMEDQGSSLRVVRFPERRLPELVRVPVARMMERSEHFVSAFEVICDVTGGFAHALQWGFWSPSLLQFLVDDNSDLIHAITLPTGTFWAACKAAASRKVPLVLTPFRHLGLRQHSMRYQRSMFQRAEAIIAVTPPEAQSFVDWGVPSEKVHCIPLGIDVGYFSSGDRTGFRLRVQATDDDFVILIPRKSREKGTIDSLDAIRGLAKAHRNLVVVLLGGADPDIADTINDRIGKLRSEGVRVTDLGHILDTDPLLRDAYAGSDLLLEPSRFEAFGLVYLEAWATGAPVVAARLRAVSDIVSDGQDGLLVNFGAVEEIEKAVDSMLSDPKFARSLGLAGKQKVTRLYNRVSMWDSTNKIYEAVLSKAHS